MKSITDLFINEKANPLSFKISDLDKMKYQGSDAAYDQIKDDIDDSLNGDVQLLDVAQTYINKAKSAIMLAEHEIAKNYSASELKKLDEIYKTLDGAFNALDKIITPKL